MLHRLLLLLLVSWGTLPTALGEDAEPPRRFAGFLETGMRLGVTPQDPSEHIRLLVFPEKEFEILLDAKTMDQEELAKKHPEFAAAREAELERFVESLKKREHELPPGVKYAEPRVGLYGYHDVLLCTVTHVGDDYFLVTFGIEKVNRKAYSTRLVSSITWQDTLPFSASVSRIKAE